MSHDLKKWLRKEIPEGEGFKLDRDFKIWRRKKNHFKQNKKCHHALGKADHFVCER